MVLLPLTLTAVWMAQEILEIPELVDDYLAGTDLTALRTLVSSQLRLAGWPGLKILSKKEQRLRLAEPQHWRVSEVNILQLRQALCQYWFPRHCNTIPPLVVPAEAALKAMASNGKKLAKHKAISNAHCDRMADRLGLELHAASWPLFKASASLCIGRRLITEAAESACKFAEKASQKEGSVQATIHQTQSQYAHGTMPRHQLLLPLASTRPSTMLQNLAPADGSAKSSSSPDASASTVVSPMKAAVESKATSAQATGCTAKRKPSAGQALTGISCPSPEDIRKADEAAALLIESEQATKASKAGKSAKAKERRQQRQLEREPSASHGSDPQASMLPEADPQGRVLMQWLLHLMSSLLWAANFMAGLC